MIKAKLKIQIYVSEKKIKEKQLQKKPKENLRPPKYDRVVEGWSWNIL